MPLSIFPPQYGQQFYSAEGDRSVGHYPQGDAGHEPFLVHVCEENPQGADMSLAEAEWFMRHMKTLTGHYPGHTRAASLTVAGIDNPSDTQLSQSWLWVVRYGREPTVKPLDPVAIYRWGGWH